MKSTPLRKNAATFVSGLIFGLGLLASGMTQPKKVIDFLDIFGSWDPTLAFVMMGAIGVHGLAYLIIKKRCSKPLCNAKFDIPTKTMIDRKLLGGSFIFGIGWGLGGYCPGPALTSLPSLGGSVIAFVAAMSVGMILHSWTSSKA